MSSHSVGILLLVVGILFCLIGIVLAFRETGARTHSLKIAASRKTNVTDGTSDSSASLGAKSQSTAIVLIVLGVVMGGVGVVVLRNESQDANIVARQSGFPTAFPPSLPSIGSPGTPAAPGTGGIASPLPSPVPTSAPWINLPSQPIRTTVEACARATQSKTDTVTCVLRITNTSGFRMNLDRAQSFALDNRGHSHSLSGGPGASAQGLWDTDSGSYGFQPGAVRRSTIVVAGPFDQGVSVIELDFNLQLENHTGYLPSWVDVACPLISTAHSTAANVSTGSTASRTESARPTTAAIPARSTLSTASKTSRTTAPIPSH